MRTHNKHLRAYVDGVDLSGYSRQVGALAWTFGAEPDASFTDEAKNIVMGQCDIQAGTLNAFLDSDAAGLYTLGSAGNGTRNLMVAIGANAAPAQGDHVFAWKFEQTSYAVEQGSGFVSATVPFGGASYASTLTYKRPWGRLLHAKGAETEVNAATGIDDIGASSALGGITIDFDEPDRGDESEEEYDDTVKNALKERLDEIIEEIQGYGYDGE